MKFFNVFKKHNESFEQVMEHGMERFEGAVIEIDNDELNEFARMPDLFGSAS